MWYRFRTDIDTWRLKLFHVQFFMIPFFTTFPCFVFTVEYFEYEDESSLQLLFLTFCHIQYEILLSIYIYFKT